MATYNLIPEQIELGKRPADAPTYPTTAAPREVITQRRWTNTQNVLFRIAFVFFVAMSLPNDWSWYKNVLSLNWLHLHYRDLYDVARFGSGLNLFGNRLFGSTLNGYATWLITLAFAIVAGGVWTAVVTWRKRDVLNYEWLYYWLRVVVRYRAGIGIIGFGFTKLMPTQLPYPSLGVLNTDFGDLTAQKIYWLSIGIVPWYEVFTGVVEVAAGALLFFRATTFWGAVLLCGALADIVYVNLAYDGGVHVYSSYFVLLSAFLLIYYVKDLYKLLIEERLTVPAYFAPVFTGWQQYVRVGLKTATIGIFLGLLFWLQWVNFRYDPYKQPAQKGLKELRGNYAVSEFKLNGQALPESATDTTRWQQATFENWTTLTFKTAKPVELDLSNGGGAPMRDINRTFELTGVAGGQRVFYYEADTVHHVLYLQDKNRGARNAERGPQENREFLVNNRDLGGQGARPAGPNEPSAKADKATATRDSLEAIAFIPKDVQALIGPEDPKIDPIARSTRRTKGIKAESKPTKRNRMVLAYTVQDGGNRVILRGLNERRDSIYVVLDRYKRNYALSESTLKAGLYE
ncbi:hypothetical protein ACAW74_23020 [Fibrella sp. WM1]|uniref:hypothetical protein n=1 Tax=Fibrella musci TaxID=3242485 RepID=UPI003522EC55